jgi:conjugal transfer pilus assembly protein TraA
MSFLWGAVPQGGANKLSFIKGRPMKIRSMLKTDLAALAGLVAVLGVGVLAAHAGTDTTFNATTTVLTNWSTGSLGKMSAVAGIAAALVGLIMKFDWRLIAGAAGIGLTASTGPGIVSALTSAIF